MSLIVTAGHIAERVPLPDAVTRLGISMLVGRTRRSLAAMPADEERRFAEGMASRPIAEHPQRANDQHYELPPEFFALTLGPRRKYSCCLFDRGAGTLEAAEVRALEETVAHAALADGQRILELGCGWGSLTLFMAERFPAARIVAVSNSAPQRRHIEAEARLRGLDNVAVVTADMNGFDAGAGFDRIVSVEMFEHMANWRALLARARGWLAPEGRMFLHVFTHRSTPYRFDETNKEDWIAQHFFTGGIMPSEGLVRRATESFGVEQEWRWSGRHYARTAQAWLANFDANRARIDEVLRDVYGAEAGLWRRRWRLFYLATAGLFAHRDGEEWGVSHYLLHPRP
ncbi:SAM-dependent methyltransferase [Ancylobacter defluvii]|uniref:Cyclopropane-fatty-acyl-phospholipid synthase n=1 Tax=Ancylobacter defluvii TaxID=1282440 RepID=A0A9W6JXG0_9HYPH|nr:cyclopropane-fatty-acyl-phospholipid synthase family protein [Ancylobacter defluvii]MBS7588801.1 class I SAM-dependent methyltransferase [Ancylobacter defluvii]GLK84089.1 cyclopropane-fatty-acyl-phospholipid synthase [Ancylobacter defluvii]